MTDYRKLLSERNESYLEIEEEKKDGSTSESSCESRQVECNVKI